MKTVGEMLKEARGEKRLTLEDISRDTRINVKYLKAIEANDFDHLPPATFTKGFMQNYAKCVGLEPKTVLAIFRRDYDSDERGRIIPRGLSEPVRSRINWFTPTTTTIVLSVTIGVLILSFFIRQIITFRSAPPLEITAPGDQAQVTSLVSVTGTTHPQATVTVNNQPAIVSESGEYSLSLDLTEGEHTLVVVATSRGGQSRTLQRVVTVLPPSE
jgi:cytoskeletal protein RodZ